MKISVLSDGTRRRGASSSVGAWAGLPVAIVGRAVVGRTGTGAEGAGGADALVVDVERRFGVAWSDRTFGSPTRLGGGFDRRRRRD